MRRVAIPALVIGVGVVLLADLLIVNASLGSVADATLSAAIFVAAGAALAAAASLAARRAGDLWRRRGDPVGALAVLVGMAIVLMAGLRPGADGAADPAVGWIVAALLVPIGATLFGLLFVTTLAATGRSIALGTREATLLSTVALVVLVLLLPIGGGIGAWLAGVAGWALAVPIGAVFRGILIGVAIVAAVMAGRTMLGIGPSDE